MIEMVIYVILGIAILLAAESVYHVVRYTGERQRALLRQRMRTLSETGGGSLLRERRLARNRALGNLLGQFTFAVRLEKLLLQTDLNWTVGTMLGLASVFSVSISAGLFMVLRANPILALVGVPIGCSLPVLYVLSVRAQRSRKISPRLKPV